MKFGIRMPGRRSRDAALPPGRRLLTQSLALALLAPLGLAPFAQAADGPAGLGRPGLTEARSAEVREIDELGAKKARAKVAEDRKANTAQARRAAAEQNGAAWPARGEATASLTGGKAATVRPGGVPVTVDPEPTGAAEARVTVLDQKAARAAGVTGVLLTAEADAARKAELTVGYGSFAAVLGGGWSQRLRLVTLPACALTTPELAKCRVQTPLRSDNDPAARTVSARVAVAGAADGPSTQLGAASFGATVLAVTAAGAGDGASPKGAGSYSATELSPSSAWQAGGSSGSFTWSYAFTVPPAAAGPEPSLGLSYDSAGVDGRTASTNNQGTSVGEGFSLTESYIERSYGSCDDDGQSDVFDRCWTYDNATLVLDGKSSKLVKDDTSGAWRLSGDDDAKVTRATGADNGDDDGEYWTVVTGNGTKYVFGLNKLEGAAADQRTDSTWTVPVFGDDSGEPGHSAGTAFADRRKTQAWRWNLDLVEDTAGNAATYWYAKETNYYKSNKATKASAAYTRGGYLKEIRYGLRKGALFTDAADAKVTFSTAERCTAADCSSLTSDTADKWPDVPFDMICTQDDTSCDASGPAFFTRKRITGLDTFSYNATTAAYDPVDSWDLVQEYLDGGDIGDSSDQVLTLKSLKRTGKAGDGAVALEPVGFTYQMRPNRVDGTDDILPLSRPRISTVTTETGAVTEVTLSSPECVRSEVTGAAEDVNTRSCYPQFWNINGAENASVDWFHKYRVLAVTVSDPSGQNPAVEYAYDYAGAAWHHSDDPFTPAAERTWSDWRGYRQVTAYSGALQSTRSKTVSLFLQGMHGDKKKDGTTKSVTLAPLAAPALGAASLTDSDQYAGLTREQVVYDGTTPISATVEDPWSKETARQKVSGAGDQVARYVRTGATTTYTYLTGAKAWRARTVATTYDDHGMTSTVEDRGDNARSGDETCRRLWYARNDTAGLTNLVSRTRLVGRACSVADTTLDLPADATRRGDVLSDTATGYDGATTWTAGMQPTKGLATWSGRAKAYTATAPAWQRTGTVGYDVLGRPLSAAGADDRIAPVTTAYTPPTAGPTTKRIVTDPKTYKTTTFVDPRRGLVQRSYDANLKKTEFTYDALGRLTGVWQPNRNKAAGDRPNTAFAYHLGSTEQPWVSTSTLKKDGTSFNTGYAIYDALLRPLQTQSPTPNGGRLLTDTRYDARGLAYETYANIFDSKNTPGGTYARAEYGGAPAQTETVYDGAGRPTTTTLYEFGVKKSTTTTGYTGDSTAVSALQGGSAVRVVTDARGRTVESREYASNNPADTGFGTGPGASYASTSYTYDLDDRQSTITAPDQAKWSYGYDLFGRETSATDPDRGRTDTGYDDLDRVIRSTDSEGRAVLTEYDDLGRTTATWAGTKADGNLLTSYAYDSVLKGLLTSSTRYVGGKAGQAYTKSVTEYDVLDRPVATRLQLPSDDPFVKAGQPATLDFSSYFNLDGTVQNSKEPALGGLPSEIVDYSYNGLGGLTGIRGSTGYLLGTDYTPLGQPQLLTLGAADTEEFKKAYVKNEYDESTGRLTRSHVTDQTHPYILQDLNYGYDEAGNVTSISDPATLGGATSAETQCFAYDGHRRLTEAWTPASQNCADARSATSLSGPAPYWTTYAYGETGQRTSETTHRSTGDTRTTYCYKKTTQPHVLTGTTTGTDCATPQRSYGHDLTGNTTGRPGASGAQDLVWNGEGELTRLTQSGKATDYLYDADGTLLIRAAQGGERVLYAGATELHLRADGTTWAQRHYSSGDATVAVRSNAGGSQQLTYLAGDREGTQSLAISADGTQSYVKRRSTPFGAERGKATGTGTWPDDRGFLDRTADAGTGLVHVSAREYDPTLGQFLSVDPLLEPANPQSLNGFGYGQANPFAFPDPSGMSNQIKCSSDCSDQVKFVDSHAAPAFGSGKTYADIYPDYPKTKVTIQAKPPVGLSAQDRAAFAAALKMVQSKKNFFGNGADTPDGMAAMSELFWGTYCDKAKSCPKDKPDATLLSDFGLRSYDTGLGMKVEKQAAASVVAGMTSAKAMQNLMDPEHVRGQTPEYIDELAKKAGMSSEPMNPRAATGGKGTRYYLAADKDVNVFYEIGDPENTSSERVHQGPYVKYQIKGSGKDGAVRVPLSGNPFPTEGGRVPVTSAQKIADFLLRVRSRGAGG
ncbi:RHS repeat-associated core domain-containing protein [Streptomyces sp. NBC_00080]|uniref:RHS repeat domain-containing protein n=1 Tax=Streptomyces TaxID=1883 RepID=UPI001E36FF27|nr:RHS repeat-associated core domain-containing protein [Streptomyces coriariae]